MKKKPPLVIVDWEDAKVLDDSAWADNDNHTYEAQIFQSVGFLLHDGPKGIILTQAWSEKMVGARDQIPRGMIRKVRKLKGVL